MKKHLTWSIISLLAIFLFTTLFIMSTDSNHDESVQLNTEHFNITVVDGTTGEKYVFEYENIPPAITETIATTPFVPVEQAVEDTVGYRWLYLLTSESQQIKIKNAQEVLINSKNYSFQHASDYTTFVNAVHTLLE